MITPMRPGRKIPASRLDLAPSGWLWQAKLDDERGVVLPDGTLWNRFGKLLAPNKTEAFSDAVKVAVRKWPGRVLDVALLGYRGHFPKGSLVVLDIPSEDGTFCQRYALIWPRCLALFPGHHHPEPGSVYYLPNLGDPGMAYSLSFCTGVEGIIGRNPEAGYEYGNSRQMVKVKHRL